MRFEPMILASEQAKTMYALDRSGTVTGCLPALPTLVCISTEYYIACTFILFINLMSNSIFQIIRYTHVSHIYADVNTS
jgi:hypothetical protein